MLIQIAHLFATLCVAIVFFQIALIAGMPWGRATQGGAHAGKLPLKNRLLALISIPILIFNALAILSAAGFADGFWPRWTGWVALGVVALSTIANYATPSAIERKIWAPIMTIVLALAAYVMITTI